MKVKEMNTKLECAVKMQAPATLSPTGGRNDAVIQTPKKVNLSQLAVGVRRLRRFNMDNPRVIKIFEQHGRRSGMNAALLSLQALELLNRSGGERTQVSNGFGEQGKNHWVLFLLRACSLRVWFI